MATQVLRDGDLAEVDVERVVVRIFKEFKKGFLSAGGFINEKTEEFNIVYEIIVMWVYLYFIAGTNEDKIKIAEYYHMKANEYLNSRI